jgi:N-acetylglucosamine kinase-like BadF-type ATPase
MNVKRFRSVLGGIVLDTIENGSPVAQQILASVTSRIAELKAKDDTENLNPASEIAALIGSVALAIKPELAPPKPKLVKPEAKAEVVAINKDEE